MEVEVTGIDAEPLCELAVRQRLAVPAEFFEDTKPQRVAERLQLLGTIDGERVFHFSISNRSLGKMVGATADSVAI